MPSYAKMPWGKEKGKLITNLPDSYLFWLYNHINFEDANLGAAINREFGKRCATKEYVGPTMTPHDLRDLNSGQLHVLAMLEEMPYLLTTSRTIKLALQQLRLRGLAVEHATWHYITTQGRAILEEKRPTSEAVAEAVSEEAGQAAPGAEAQG